MFALGQEERDTVFTNDTIRIHGQYNAANVVVLYESPTFTVSSDYASIISSLKSHVKAHDIDWDKKLLRQLQDRAKTPKQRIAAAQSDPQLKSRLAFRTMDLLKLGKCVVRNQANGVTEARLIHQDYQKKWWTGTRFLTLDGHLVFDIQTGAF